MLLQADQPIRLQYSNHINILECHLSRLICILNTLSNLRKCPVYFQIKPALDVKIKNKKEIDAFVAKGNKNDTNI